MDFILALLPTLSGLDYVLTVTYKFSKKVTIILGVLTYTAKD